MSDPSPSAAAAAATSSGGRVLFVGIGTFLVAFFGVITLLSLILARLLKQVYVAVVGIVMFVIVILVLALSPRESTATAATAAIYSTFFRTQYGIAALMAFSAVVSCVGLALFSLPVVRHAKVVD
jgi:hypothetical protein